MLMLCYQSHLMRRRARGTRPTHRLSEAESIVSRSDPGGVQRSASSGSGALTGDAALEGAAALARAAGRADNANDRSLRALERCRFLHTEFSNRIEY